MADVPADPGKLENSSTLVSTCTPVKVPAVNENLFRALTMRFFKCSGKRVVFDALQSNGAKLEAMHSRR